MRRRTVRPHPQAAGQVTSVGGDRTHSANVPRKSRRADRYTPPITVDVLVLCTANVCRSPIAAALLERALAERGLKAIVRSAGWITQGQSPPPEAIKAMAPLGLDISRHVSERLEVGDVAAADLILGMGREHVREAVVLDPSTWGRSFTIKEFVRRGEKVGPRSAGQSLEDWLAILHAERQRSDLLGSSSDDDVADPIGGPLAAYTATARELEDLVRRLVELAWPRPAQRRAPAVGQQGSGSSVRRTRRRDS